MGILARVGFFPGARCGVVAQSPEFDGEPVEASLATPEFL
jgi:hypothetical protein